MVAILTLTQCVNLILSIDTHCIFAHNFQDYYNDVDMIASVRVK